VEGKPGADSDPDIRYSLADKAQRGGSPTGGKTLTDSITGWFVDA
jgi:hypothetical protein